MILVRVIQYRGYWEISSEYNIADTQEDIIKEIKSKFCGEKYKIEMHGQDMIIYKNGKTCAEIQIFPEYNYVNAKYIASSLFEDIN